jgi:hypothetical protein
VLIIRNDVIEVVMPRNTRTVRRTRDWLTASKRELRRGYAEAAAEEARRPAELQELDQAWLNGLIGDVLLPEC